MANSALDLFERTAGAEGRLLDATRRSAVGSDSATLGGAFLLTFDVGRLLVEVEVSRGELCARALELGQEVDGAWKEAGEEEPWWRLLGNPLVRCGASPGAIRLQFRNDDEDPRVLSLAVEEGLVRAAVSGGGLGPA